MAGYRVAVYRPARRYRSPYGRRNSGTGAIAVVVLGAVVAAGTGAHAAVTSAHGKAKASVKPQAQPVRVVAVTGGSKAAFITATLADLGAPGTAANEDSLAGWFRHEYPTWPAWADNNPMSSTLTMPGSWTYNTLPDGLHVQNYPSAAEGAEATALTLEGGDWYPQILAALRSGDGICGGGFAAELLTWSGNGYSEVC